MDHFITRLMSVVVVIIFGIPMLIRGAYYQNVTPQKLERRLGIQLPELAVIECYEYNSKGDRLCVKLFVDEDDLEVWKSLLTDYCESRYSSGIEIGPMPNIQNTVEWWDLDKNEIEFFYQRMTKGKYGMKTSMQYIFMAKDMAGEMCFWFVN